jgi:TolA-binding protein
MALYRCLFLILLALLCAAVPARAAGAREQRAYVAAVTAFHDGLWNLAQLEFAQFAQKYPGSTNLPEAYLLEAQAAFKQGGFTQGGDLLTTHRPAAGKFADAYTYWIGEAQFQNDDWRTAATTLASLSENSPYALQGAVEAAAALAKLGDWSQLIAYCGVETEVFQRTERSDPDNELLLRAHLLLAQAHFAQGEFAAAGKLLALIKPRLLPPDLEWERVYLLCQVKLAAGDREAALPLATSLLQMARTAAADVGGTNLAASVALNATVLEDLGRLPEAIQAFRENLSTNAPADSQRQAILKIAVLSIDARQFANAEAVLNDYVTQFTNSPAVDVALLTLGELYLQDYVAQPAQSGLLASARAQFDQLLTICANSAFTGKAYLDRGWCGWLAGDYAGSLPDFQNATQLLPRSEDLAVARFKLGDALFARADYADALIQYQAVLGHFTSDFPEVEQSLGDRARYQSLRAQLALGDLTGAAASMGKIATAYPVSELRQTGSLLLGEGYTDLRQPTNALAVFKSFKDQAPGSPLRPLVDLAVARVYEQEQNWPAAVARYDTWLQSYPTNSLLPQALYARAWANYQAGNETNALNQFTNFVTRFPTLPDLAPSAQWWVADHYFRLGDSVNAERNYKTIFQNTNWQNSASFTNSLYYPALMMAGRAAVSRTDNAEAIRDYFLKLEADTNCPLDLRVAATFAHGSALMKMDSTDTNNLTANFQYAVTVFNQICSASLTNNDWGARAWGEMGDCYLQLARYDDATNAYLQVLAAPQANLSLQSQAQIGLGQALEKKAGLLSAGPDQTALYTQALANYWEVFNRTGEEKELDPFWTKEAGLDAANLVTALGKWDQAMIIYTNLVAMMPELKTSLARKMEESGRHLNQVKP